MKRLNAAHVRQAQRFAGYREEFLAELAELSFDPLRPAEDRSEAEADRYAEFAQDAAEDARIDYESEE